MERLSEQYTTAQLEPEIIEKIKAFETELRQSTAKDLVLIAYEEIGHK